jgi:epoxyqueuosine reductase
MNPKELTNAVYSQLESHNFKGKIVSIEHFAELQEEFEAWHKQGLLDQKLYQSYLTKLDFKVPERLPAAKSLFVATVPQPQLQAVFTVNEKLTPVIVPPTYSSHTDRQVETLLKSLLEPEGYSLIEATLPEKLLAVRSGLARYGKNNITYVSGMGSFHRPVAFYTDLPCIDDNWGEPQIMESCNTCSACLKACPTDAIASDRFLVHAERCITFLNELPGEFPDWFEPSWHNCLIGCLLCQKCCPANKEVSTWVEEQAEFSPEETTLILQGTPEEKFSAETVKKLEQLGLRGEMEILPRNLRVLVDR